MGKYETINCGAQIDEGDIFRQISSRELDELSKKLLRAAAAYISGNRGSIWKNAEIAVLGPSIQLLFVAGNEANQFVVTVDEDDTIKKYCKERGWRMLTEDAALYVWEVVNEKLIDSIIKFIMGLLSKGANAVGSSEKKAIGF